MKRIDIGEFVTPPEFAGMPSASRSAGQIGGVRIELVNSGGRTRLGSDCYQQVPVRILPPFHFAGESAALLYLLNPTAGLLDGDAHAISIVARAGTRTIVTGQSATRIHPARASFGTQQWNIRVEAGAELAVLPGPAIPYRGSRYYQRVEVDLEPGAHFLWADIWLPGRYDRGADSEWFTFERIVQELNICRSGERVYRERFDWNGPWDREQIGWFCGEGNGMASLFATPSPRGNPTGLLLASGDTFTRWNRPPKEIIGRVVETAMHTAGSWSSGEEGWLLESHNFPPNHWFSFGRTEAVITTNGEKEPRTK